MKAVLFPWLVAAALVVGPAVAADLRIVTFRAPVENVREARKLLEQGFESDETVEVKERAILFKPPLVIADLRSPGLPQNEELRFLISYLQANMSGTAEQMADFWGPEERPAMLKQMRDPDRLKQNRAYFAKMPGITILAVVYQPTTTTIFLARGGGGGTQAVHLRRAQDRYFLTKAPENDLSIAIIEASFPFGSQE